MKQGFDAKKYLEQQSKYILERVNNFDKLYIEFGGKLSEIYMQRGFYLDLMKMLR